MSKEEKGLVVVEFNPPTMLSQEEVAEEMDGLQFNFAYVKVPSGGGLAFEVPGEDDDEPDIMKTLEGVIVYHHPLNAYWMTAYDGSNNRPDCASYDGKIGIGDPGGDCRTCPFNQWGSGRDGKGKACNNRHRVYLLQKGEMLPLLFSLPPTSLNNFSNLISRKILQKKLRSHEVVVQAKLKKATSGGGIDYSQVAWAVVGRLSPADAEAMKDYSSTIRSFAGEYSVEEVEGAGEFVQSEEFYGTEINATQA